MQFAVSVPHSAAANEHANHFLRLNLCERMVGDEKIFTPRVLTSVAVLVALNVILTKFLSVTLVYVRISFNFLPIALCSMLYGPTVGGVAALLADVLGVIIVGEPLFWGYSVSALLYGVTYGLFLFGHEKSYKNIIFCVSLQTVLIDILLGALWANIFFGKPYVVALWAGG